MAIIRLSGNNGAGKTTLGKRLADHFGYRYVYTGAIFRAMAEEQGLSIEAFYKKISSDPGSETEVDSRQAKLMNESDNLFVEGRIAPFQPSVFKTINVLFTVEPLEGARRQLLRPENKEKTVEEMLALSNERLLDEQKHYRALYGIEDHLDPRHFDIVIDTTHCTIDEVFTKAVSAIREALEKN